MVRGLRNKNVYNIRYNNLNKWIGLVGKDKDGFCIFDTHEHGCRAAVILLRNYLRKGINTPAKIISRFAPASENDTNAYISSVCTYGLLRPDEPIRFGTTEFIRLMQAMSRVESLFEYDRDYIRNIITSFKIKA